MRKGSFGEISAIQAELDKGRIGGDRPGYIIVKTFRQIRQELDAQGKITASVSQNGVLQIFEVGNQAPVNVDLDPNSPGTANQAARRDHHHHLDEDIAPTWTSPHAWVVPTAELSEGVGALNVTATLGYTGTVTAAPVGVEFNITSPTTSANPTNQSAGVQAVTAYILAGYTGKGGTFGIGAQNQVAGTGLNIWFSESIGGGEFQSANYGIWGRSIATTTGHNVGMQGIAYGGAVNVGSIASSFEPKAAAVNCAFAGLSRNASNTSGQIGMFLGIYGSATPGASFTQPTLSTNAPSVLIVDNGVASADVPLAKFCMNGVVVTTVQRSGAVGINGAASGFPTNHVPLFIARNDSTTAPIFQIMNGTQTANFYRIDSGGNVVLQDGTGDATALFSIGSTALASTYDLGLHFGPRWGTSAGQSFLGVVGTYGVLCDPFDNASATAPYTVGGLFIGSQNLAARAHSGSVGGIFSACSNIFPSSAAHGNLYGWWVKASPTVGHGATSTATASYGGYIDQLWSGGLTNPVITTVQGLAIEKQTKGATNNNSIFLADSGAGSTYKALAFRDQNTWINANDDSHLDLHAATSIDLNIGTTLKLLVDTNLVTSSVDLEMASQQYILMTSDGASYLGGTPAAGKGQFAVIDNASGDPIPIFVNDAANQLQLYFDPSIQHTFNDTITFAGTPGIKVDTIAKNAGSAITFSDHVDISTKDITTDTTTGTKIGTAAGQKLGFFGSTPQAQQTAAGAAGGFTAGAGAAVDHLATWNGTGGTAYTIGDIVIILKAYGLLAA